MTPAVRQASILCARIPHYARVAELMSPMELAGFTGAALGDLEGAIRRTGGEVLRFTGDGLAALWGAPAAAKDHSLGACLGALACDDAFASFARRHRVAEGPSLEAAVCSGPMAVGLMEYGARKAFDAVGDTVVLASRLQALNRFFGTRLLATQAAFKPVAELLIGRPLGLVRIPGREAPVRLFELMRRREGAPPAVLKAAASHARGMQQFEARDFLAASRSFKTVLSIHEGDRPALLLTRMSEEFASRPPPPDWDATLDCGG